MKEKTRKGKQYWFFLIVLGKYCLEPGISKRPRWLVAVIKLKYSNHMVKGQFGQFSHSVASSSLWPDGLQCARPPCPSPTPRVDSNSCLLSRWCHPTISSSVVPVSSCLQSLPASESFPMSQLFTWGGQSTGVLALASFLPKKSQGWSPSEWTSCSPRDAQVFSNTTVQKHQFLGTQPSSQSNSHILDRPLGSNCI